MTLRETIPETLDKLVRGIPKKQWRVEHSGECPNDGDPCGCSERCTDTVLAWDPVNSEYRAQHRGFDISLLREGDHNRRYDEGAPVCCHTGSWTTYTLTLKKRGQRTQRFGGEDTQNLYLYVQHKIGRRGMFDDGD